jgi:hypothetical protein
MASQGEPPGLPQAAPCSALVGQVIGAGMGTSTNTIFYQGQRHAGLDVHP